MASVHVLHPRVSLGPDELHIAGDTFRGSDPGSRWANGWAAAGARRDILAKYIAERALLGERDPQTLRDGALECLNLMTRASTS